MDRMEYRKMLIELSNKLTGDDLSRMKFMCADFISRRRQEEIQDGTAFWLALEGHDRMGPENLDFLKYLIESGTDGRADLINVMQKYTGRNNNVHTPGQYMTNDADMAQEFHVVTENVGRYWKNLARCLGLTEMDIECIAHTHTRDLREQVYQSLLRWKQKFKMSADRDQLIKALEMCDLNRVAGQIKALPQR